MMRFYSCCHDDHMLPRELMSNKPKESVNTKTKESGYLECCHACLDDEEHVIMLAIQGPRFETRGGFCRK